MTLHNITGFASSIFHAWLRPWTLTWPVFCYRWIIFCYKRHVCVCTCVYMYTYDSISTLQGAVLLPIELLGWLYWLNSYHHMKQAMKHFNLTNRWIVWGRRLGHELTHPPMHVYCMSSRVYITNLFIWSGRDTCHTRTCMRTCMHARKADHENNENWHPMEITHYNMVCACAV